MAYAHDHGVIHRDLKPANVMIGDYGEVYVVDWGLAKIAGAADSPDRAARESDPPAGEDRSRPESELTIEGDVIGTPAYMPPEQADGRASEVGARSDLYSLGAILYEILAFSPPFEGDSGVNVIAKILSTSLTPPSAKVSAIRERAGLREASQASEATRTAGWSAEPVPPPRAAGEAAPFLPDPVPPDLEEIVLKAMAKDPARRHASARDLYEDVQRHLEGERERERNRERARGKIEEGWSLVAGMERMRAELKGLESEAREQAKEVKPFWPAERKASLWASEARCRALREEVARVFGRAGTAFHEALGFERGNPEARAALAALYWDQFVREEKTGDAARMAYFGGLVREYDDGAFAERIRGDGTLSVATRAYRCRCLLEGRRVPPEEFSAAPEGDPPPRSPEDWERRGILGYHPLSGRALDGRPGSKGLPELEPASPRTLRVHGPGCGPEPLAGADAWLFRFEERGRILVPVKPPGIAPGPSGSPPLPGAVPQAVLDRLFDPGSPFRPAEGLYLGKTPVAPLRIPMGSYLLVLAGPPGDRKDGGWAPVRVPVFVGRNADVAAGATLYREREIPPGFVQVPAGSFFWQGDKGNPYSGPGWVLDADDFFLSRFPVTCGQYRDFLNALAGREREGGPPASRHVPRENETALPCWPRLPDGTFAVPTDAWLAAAPPDLAGRARRIPMSPADWAEQWPVLCVSWEDMMRYAAWRSEETGTLLSLPHEKQREKAARGADGRFFPWGNEADFSFCNGNLAHAEGARPCPVDSFPVDESPYGVRGLAGNARDFCLNDPGEQYVRWRVMRGGHWAEALVGLRSASRVGSQEHTVYFLDTMRLTFHPRLGPPRTKPPVAMEEE